MLETYTTVLTDISRNLYRNMRDAPFLYLWFGFMMVFSVLMMAALTMFLMSVEVEVNIDDVFFAVLFAAVAKSGVDFYKYFVKAPAVSYALSTPVHHRRTLFEIFLVVFWVQLGLWVLFSSLYSMTLVAAGICIGYPVVYVQFTMGVVLATIFGTLITLHFFSPKRYRLIPIGVLVAVLWYSRDLYVMLGVLLVAAWYLWWSLGHALESYQYVNRKERQKERAHVRVRNVTQAIFEKETTILWRDKLLFSYVFTASILGIFSGYLAGFGGSEIIPEGLRALTEQLSPTMYSFLGVYVATIYTSVFPSLNLFLAEEHTMWIVRHLPVDEKTIVHGKAGALVLPLVASIPFVAFFVAFTGVDYLAFTVWFLVFAFLIGTSVAVPLGVKYVGKKSDVLLLYSVAMIVFVILGVMLGVENVLERLGASRVLFYGYSLLGGVVVLLGSLQLSSRVLRLKYEQRKSLH